MTTVNFLEVFEGDLKITEILKTHNEGNFCVFEIRSDVWMDTNIGEDMSNRVEIQLWREEDPYSNMTVVNFSCPKDWKVISENQGRLVTVVFWQSGNDNISTLVYQPNAGIVGARKS